MTRGGGSNPSSIEPLFRAHFDAIYRYAVLRVGRDSALDVAAETFTQALHGLDRLDPDRDPRPWLFGVATNVLRHHRRAETRRLRAYARAVQVDTHIEVADSVVERDRLIEGLTELDARDRDAILLFAWAELSYEEIATVLEIPVGTVRSRIHRARKTLRAALAEPPATAGDAQASRVSDSVVIKEA